MGNELCKLAIEHRAKGQKVSQNFMRMQAKKLIKTGQPSKVDSFKASIG